MTELTSFLDGMLALSIKRDIEDEIGEKIDDQFFQSHYKESIDRWKEFHSVEFAHSLYSEAVEEIKADWLGRNSKLAIDQAKDAWSGMDEDERLDFLRWANA